MTTLTPIRQISAEAAAVLRITLMGRADQIIRLYRGDGRAQMLESLRHCCRELGIDPADIINEWTVVRFHVDGERTLQLLQNGRSWRMRGNGDHDLYDSGEERALAHWKGYISR